MKFDNKQRFSENLLYFLVWSVIVLVPVLNAQMLGDEDASWRDVMEAWQRILPYLIIFLVHNGVVAPRLLLDKHRYAVYLGVDLAIICTMFGAVEFFMNKTPETTTLTDLPFWANVLLGFFMTGLNSGIKLLYRSLSDERELEELKRKNLEAEMDSLKYQINPHFLMNTLNNIHALIDIDARAAQGAVIDLSKMMRYVLYDSGVQYIPLKEDLRFIQNYISLMRIRYAEQVQIDFDRPPEVPIEARIPPLLLVVFVENAFKHGISYSVPSFIHIALECENNRIRFHVRNSRHAVTHRRKGGIGLENVRKRLELLYHDRYSLLIENSDDLYSISLNIPLC